MKDGGLKNTAHRYRKGYTVTSGITKVIVETTKPSRKKKEGKLEKKTRGINYPRRRVRINP